MHTYFPAIDYGVNIALPGRRNRATRRAYDISVSEVDFSTNLFERNRQVDSRSAISG